MQEADALADRALEYAREITRLRLLLVEARECEGLQNWDPDLCERIDQALYFDGDGYE